MYHVELFSYTKQDLDCNLIHVLLQGDSQISERFVHDNRETKEEQSKKIKKNTYKLINLITII